jgi:hypothetical protein
MRRRAIPMLVGALGLLGCGEGGYGWDLLGDETTDPIPTEPPAPLACDYCVHTAPATYTGPSSFYRGRLDDAPDCHDPTPWQGIQGFLLQPTSPIQFVRECRFTPSDTCETEGQVCAPLPDADFQTCIHHTGEVDCPPEYSSRRETILVEGTSSFVFTLCCMAAPGPA